MWFWCRGRKNSIGSVINPLQHILWNNERRANFLMASISISRNPVEEIPWTVFRILHALAPFGLCSIADDDAAEFYMTKLFEFVTELEGVGAIYDVRYTKIDDKTKDRLITWRKNTAEISFEILDAIRSKFLLGIQEGNKRSKVQIGAHSFLNVYCPEGKSSKSFFPSVYGIIDLLERLVGYCVSTGVARRRSTVDSRTF